MTAAGIPGNLAAMELADLNQDERTALVGLMKLIVLSDGNVTEDELEHVETLVDAFGEGEYQRTLEVLKTHGWSPARCVPHGGHQMSLNIAAGLGLGGNESYPDLFQPYGGFPDGVRVENGHITMPDLPGIGFEGKADLYKEMKALAA